jgi:hypothetical protein
MTNKRVLIISPYFPPSNAADMHRIRMSLPYFKEFGWDATVVTVDANYSDQFKDDLLTKSIPTDACIYYVKAFDKKATSKFGLGAIALRSLYFYYKKVNELLSTEKFDLVYFSTTQFPVCVLGAVWKKKFKIPYVIDFQDPWFSNYYNDKPKDKRPPKYWFAYRLNKYLEPIAVKNADGLISVSANYISDLKKRYPLIKDIPAAVIIFGASEIDRQIALNNQQVFTNFLSAEGKNLVYVGRGGYDMHSAIIPLFKAVQQLLSTKPQYAEKLRLYFIGTSYAPKDTGIATILPLARKYGLQDVVIEDTNRIGYYNVLAILNSADALFVPGSDDPAYIASKLLPFVLARKPLLTIFNSQSSAAKILVEFEIENAYLFDKDKLIVENIKEFLIKLIEGKQTVPVYNKNAIEKYNAQTLTGKQCNLFNMVINKEASKGI